MSITILADNRIATANGARVVDGELWMPDTEYERVLGHAPAAAAVPDGCRRDGGVDVSGCWRRLGRPVLSAAAGDVWVLGASARERAAALESLQAPDFTLPDLDGRPHSLADYRGRKVFLASWSSW